MTSPDYLAAAALEDALAQAVLDMDGFVQTFHLPDRVALNSIHRNRAAAFRHLAKRSGQMTNDKQLDRAGWVFHGEGTWTLDRPGLPALMAQENFDGSAPEEIRWTVYEDQGDTDGDSRWGEPVGVRTLGELLELGGSQ